MKIKEKYVIETWGSEIENKNVEPKVLELHNATSEELAHTVDD